MTDDDLGEALADLEDTRATAEKELKTLRGRQAALEELERDRDTLLESYAAMVPEALDALVPEERRQVYMMLRLKVELSRDESIEVRGVLSDSLRGPLEDGEGLCESELASERSTTRRLRSRNSPVSVRLLLETDPRYDQGPMQFVWPQTKLFQK